MANTITTNPYETSGRAAGAYTSLTYPVNETLVRRTVLRFVKYDRDTPASDPTSNITAIINLPIPMNTPESISIKTGNYDVGIRASAKDAYDLVTGGKLVDTIKNTIEGYKNTTNAPKDLARAAALLPTGLNDDRAAIASIVGGVVKNPHTTTFFDGVNLRSYSLTWEMMPRNKQESDVLNEIIKTLRERTLPDESFKGYALEYPDLCYVDFEGDFKEYMPKFYRSFVQSVNIGFTGSGGLTFYDSGAPTRAEINLSLVETNILTRRVIAGDGF